MRKLYEIFKNSKKKKFPGKLFSEIRYVSKNFGLKMMMKSGLEKLFFEIPPCVKPCLD